MLQNLRINLKKVCTAPIPMLAGLLAAALVGAVGWFFYDLDLTIGNFGHTLAYTEVGLYVLFAIFFGLFVAVTTYKIRYFHKVDGKTVGYGSIGGLFGLLVAGCPACSITLASYLGVAAFLTVLPFKGMELKVIGILILGYVIYDTLNSLETCRVEESNPFSGLTNIAPEKWIIGLVVTGGAVISGWAVYNYLDREGIPLLPGQATVENVANNEQPFNGYDGCDGSQEDCGCEGEGTITDQLWC